MRHWSRSTARRSGLGTCWPLSRPRATTIQKGVTKPSTPQRFNMSGPRSPWQTLPGRNELQARQHQSTQKSRICLSESQNREQRHFQQHTSQQDRCGRRQQPAATIGTTQQQWPRPAGSPGLTRAISRMRAANASPATSRTLTKRKPPIDVWERPSSRHHHRTPRIRSPAEQQNDGPDSPRHASCTHHYNRRKTVQRLTFQLRRPVLALSLGLSLQLR